MSSNKIIHSLCLRRHQLSSSDSKWFEFEVADSDSSTSMPSSTFQERLKKSIGSVNEERTIQKQIKDRFKSEFDFYDRHQERGPLLNKFLEDLLSIQPISIQSERNFSLAAGMATKTRTKMSSQKLHALCFLKSFFINMK